MFFFGVFSRGRWHHQGRRHLESNIRFGLSLGLVSFGFGFCKFLCRWRTSHFCFDGFHHYQFWRGIRSAPRLADPTDARCGRNTSFHQKSLMRWSQMRWRHRKRQQSGTLSTLICSSSPPNWDLQQKDIELGWRCQSSLRIGWSVAGI